MTEITTNKNAETLKNHQLNIMRLHLDTERSFHVDENNKWVNKLFSEINNATYYCYNASHWSLGVFSRYP